MNRVPFDIPIDPDRETARRWLEDELSKRVYSEDGQSWLPRLLDRISEWFSHLFHRVDRDTQGLGVAGVPGSIVAGLVFVIVLAVLAYLFLGPLRSSRRAKKSATVFEDDDRSADAMAKAAEEAAARGDWDTAVLDRFRSIVRRAENEGWVAVIPGMTAYEFVEQAAQAAMALAAELLWAGDIFDRVRYGHATGSKGIYERLGRLDEQAKSTRFTKVPS